MFQKVIVFINFHKLISPNDGKNKTSTVKSSNLPSNILKIISILIYPVYFYSFHLVQLYLQTGPTLEIELAAPEIEVKI